MYLVHGGCAGERPNHRQVMKRGLPVQYYGIKQGLPVQYDVIEQFTLLVRNVMVL